MPFKSQKQRAWMHVNKPAMAKKWEKETGNKDLPMKAKAMKSVAEREKKNGNE